MRKLTFLLMTLVLISFVSAETEVYKVNEEVNLPFTCLINGAIPSASATTNITITYPNGSYFVNNQPTTALGNGAFNYTTTFIEIGEYKVLAFCYDGSDGISVEGIYDVTPTGKSFTLQKANTYIALFLISILLFIGLLILGVNIPSKNKTNEMTGYILAINNLKYLKYFILALSYISLIGLSYFAWMLSYAYLDFEFVSTLLKFIFYFLAILTLPLFILYAWINIANLVRDSNVKDLLLRGLSTR